MSTGNQINVEAQKDPAELERETRADARHRVSDTSRHTADRLRQQTERARGGFNHLLNEQPLALGAMGIALGALLAASVPPTRREDELLGQASDSMTDNLRHKAEEGYHKVSDRGHEVVGKVKSEIERSDTSQARSGPTPGL